MTTEPSLLLSANADRLGNIPDDRARVAVRSTPSNHTTFELIDTRDGFLELRTQWNNLFERAGRPSGVFQTHDWNRLWIEAYLGEPSNARTLAIMTAWREGRLILVMPFIIETFGGIRCLKWMGEPVSQYGDILVDNIPDAASIALRGWQEVQSRLTPDAAWLRYVRQDAVVFPLLREQNAVAIDVRQAPYLDLSHVKSHAELMQRYRPKTLKNRRRLAKRLAEHAHITLSIEHAGPRARALTEAALALKHSWLDRRHTYSSAFTDNRIDGFFSAIATCGARHAEPVIAAIEADGRLIAAAIALVSKGQAMLHILTYDQSYARYGVGIQALDEIIRYCLANEISCLDLLAPGSDFKASWTDQSIAVADYALPLTWRGQIYVSGFIRIARPCLRKLMTSISATRAPH